MAERQIRPARDADLAALNAIYNHYIEHTAITFDIEPWTAAERANWFASFDARGRHRLLVLEDGPSGELLGYACSRTFRTKAAYAPSVETSIYLRHDATGAGLGRPLYTALFDALANEDVHRAYAGVTLPNDASERLHERIGFRPIGLYHEVGRKFDRWWSVRWFEKRLGGADA